MLFHLLNCLMISGKTRRTYMGGYGSGGSRGGKETTGQYRALDIWLLKRNGSLTPGVHSRWGWKQGGKRDGYIEFWMEENRLILSYKYRERGEDWKAMEYPVYLDWTPCNFGGYRPWFICPVRGCGRRVAKLYGGAIFACRHCHQLGYASQREDWYDRADRRANKIRSQLGWELGIANPKGPKPKGMHWKTFFRLVAEHDEWVYKSVMGVATKLKLL